MKKRLFAIIFSIVFIVCCVTVLCVHFVYSGAQKTVNVHGYEISIPKNWLIDSKGNIYDKDGNYAGLFLLGDLDVKVWEEDESFILGSSNEISESVIKYEGLYKNRDCTVYFIRNLPNPEPYNASLLFFDEFVKENIAKKIYNSFKIPQFGKNPPEKNKKALSISEVGDDKICRIEFIDGTVTVKNIKLLNTYRDVQNQKKSIGFDILSYKEDKDGNIKLESWSYIESDNGNGYLYSYYDKGEGIYTYDNDAVLFESITKEISDDKEITSYSLISEKNEKTVLLQIPLNRYRDNAEQLIEMKTMSAKREDIQNILNKIMSKKELELLTFDVTSNALLITYQNGIDPDRKKAYSDAAVLFSLAHNLDSITIVYNNGTEYTFTRAFIEKSLESSIDSAAENKENFVDYTEKIDNTHQSQIQDGDMVYSGTVLINYNTIVTHPKTGERVEVGPYAESKGYGQYLGKPIYCTIRKSGSGYIASASSGGNVIGSYPLNSEAELNAAINLIKAYS